MVLKKEKVSKRIYFFGVLSVVSVVGVLFIFKNLNIVQARTPVVSAVRTLPVEQTKKVIVSVPVRFRIPKLNVDASVQDMGVTRQGIMDSPKGPKEVGWFALGVRPGEVGSAVIDGHSGWKNNIPAVFDTLHTLKAGDKVLVEDEKGVIHTFIVREIKIYKSNQRVEGIFDSSDGKAHLNLITCTGFWNKILKGRSDRLVVFTDIEVKK